MTGIFYERPNRPIVVTEQDVRRVLGPVDDDIVAAIQDTGATREDLVRAYAWFDEDDDDEAVIGKPLTYRSRRVYDILREDFDDIDRYAR